MKCMVLFPGRLRAPSAVSTQLFLCAGESSTAVPVPVFSAGSSHAAVPLQGQSHDPSAPEYWASGAGSVWQAVQIPLLLCSCPAGSASPCWLPPCWLCPAPCWASWTQGSASAAGNVPCLPCAANWRATSSETPLRPPRSRSLIPRDGLLFDYKGIASP